MDGKGVDKGIVLVLSRSQTANLSHLLKNMTAMAIEEGDEVSANEWMNLTNLVALQGQQQGMEMQEVEL